MKCNLVGKEKINYVSRKTGQPVVGLTLHTFHTLDKDKGEGAAVESFYISQSKACYADALKAPIGSDIELFFDRYGSVDTVSVCKR